jgi:hypothetical protein
LSPFGKQVRRVRSEALPEKTRLIAFILALDAFGRRTNQDAGAVLDRLGAALAFNRTQRPSIAQALAAVDVLERERNTHVEHWRGFARRRVREKARGQQHVSEADRERWASRAGCAPVPLSVREAWGLLAEVRDVVTPGTANPPLHPTQGAGWIASLLGRRKRATFRCHPARRG